MLTAITPVTIELALATLTDLEHRDHEIGAQWRMRIERARYEADLAERRYEAVDPSNRLIASTLEQRWNDALQRLHDLEAELANFERQTMRAITAEQKQQIRRLTRLRGFGRFDARRPFLINGLAGKVFTTDGDWGRCWRQSAVVAAAADRV